MKNTIVSCLVMFVGVVALAVALSALCALPFMWLWNALMPDIFGLKVIGFLQAWGLLILSSFLFKSTASTSKKD